MTTQPNTPTPRTDADALRVTTLDAKYTVVLSNEGRLTALRHGRPWRECIGDTLILTLAQDIETLHERVRTLERELSAVTAERDALRKALEHVCSKGFEDELWDVIHFHPECESWGHARSSRLAASIRRVIHAALNPEGTK